MSKAVVIETECRELAPQITKLKASKWKGVNLRKWNPRLMGEAGAAAAKCAYRWNQDCYMVATAYGWKLGHGTSEVYNSYKIQGGFRFTPDGKAYRGKIKI